LHLIHPLGFSTDNKMLKRAGLDYWKNVNVIEYETIFDLYNQYKDGIFYYIENFGDSKRTRLISSHVSISYAFFCLIIIFYCMFSIASFLSPIALTPSSLTISLHDALPIFYI